MPSRSHSQFETENPARHVESGILSNLEVLTRDSTVIHYAWLHAIITEDSPIRVRIFQEREQAARRFGLPPERLAARFGGKT